MSLCVVIEICSADLIAGEFAVMAVYRGTGPGGRASRFVEDGFDFGGVCYLRAIRVECRERVLSLVGELPVLQSILAIPFEFWDPDLFRDLSIVEVGKSGYRFERVVGGDALSRIAITALFKPVLEVERAMRNFFIDEVYSQDFWDAELQLSIDLPFGVSEPEVRVAGNCFDRGFPGGSPVVISQSRVCVGQAGGPFPVSVGLGSSLSGVSVVGSGGPTSGKEGSSLPRTKDGFVLEAGRTVGLLPGALPGGEKRVRSLALAIARFMRMEGFGYERYEQWYMREVDYGPLEFHGISGAASVWQEAVVGLSVCVTAPAGVGLACVMSGVGTVTGKARPVEVPVGLVEGRNRLVPSGVRTWFGCLSDADYSRGGFRVVFQLKPGLRIAAVECDSVYLGVVPCEVDTSWVVSCVDHPFVDFVGGCGIRDRNLQFVVHTVEFDGG